MVEDWCTKEILIHNVVQQIAPNYSLAGHAPWRCSFSISEWHSHHSERRSSEEPGLQRDIFLYQDRSSFRQQLVLSGNLATLIFVEKRFITNICHSK